MWPNGNLKRTCEVVGDDQHGLETIFKPDGHTIQSTCEYNCNQKHGQERFYYSDGFTLKSMQSYYMGKKHGECLKYSSGKEVEISHWLNGQLIESKFFRDDGTPWYARKYLLTSSGRVSFEEIRFDQDGRPHSQDVTDVITQKQVKHSTSNMRTSLLFNCMIILSYFFFLQLSATDGKNSWHYDGGVNMKGAMHGKGKMVWSDESFYDGHWFMGKKHGLGTYKKSDGSIYDGEFRDDLENGHGNFTSTGFEYTGEFRGGVKHGHGTMKFQNKDVYTGEFCDDTMNGHGTLKKEDQSTYEGDFCNGLYHGLGTLVLSSGTFVGEFCDCNMHGQGIFKFIDGDTYQGGYEANLKHGSGTFIFNDGHVYKGEFVGGENTGEGQLLFPSGNLYSGEFHAGHFCGNGRLNLAAGGVYIGIFDGWKIKGIFETPNGSVNKIDQFEDIDHNEMQKRMRPESVLNFNVDWMSIRWADVTQLPLQKQKPRSAKVLRDCPGCQIVNLQKDASGSFGFSIGKKNSSKFGIKIKRILQGSPIDNCGTIRVGDCIVMIDDHDIRLLELDKIKADLKTAKKATFHVWPFSEKSRVRICNFDVSSDQFRLNGRTGVICDHFNYHVGTFTVHIDGQPTPISICPQNLEPYR